MLFAFFLLNCNGSLYILDINSLLDTMNTETNFWLLEITENLARVVVSVHNRNKNIGLVAKV